MLKHICVSKSDSVCMLKHVCVLTSDSVHAKDVQQQPPSLGEDAACEDKSELIF